MDDLTIALTAYNNAKLDRAAIYAQRVLNSQKNSPVALKILGLVAHRRRHFENAITYLEQAHQSCPNDPEILFALGKAKLDAGRFEEGALNLENIVILSSKIPVGYGVLGNTFKSLGRFEEAVACHEKAVKEEGTSAERWSDLASTYLAWDKVEAAIEGYKVALQIKPDSVELLYNLGSAYQIGNQFHKAIDHLSKVIEILPTHVRAHINLGVCLKSVGRMLEAKDILRKAVALDEQNADAQWNLALTLLLLGEMEEGWQGYEWRRRIPSIPIRNFAQPSWDGSNAQEKSILLHAEQGMGDTIQFVRFAKYVRQRVGRVLFDCQAPLTALLEGVEGVDQILPRGRPLPAFDLQSPLLSLPLLLGMFHGDAAVPYLDVDPRSVAQWKERLDDLRGFKIGISWQGNPSYRADRQRSIPLHFFQKLLQVDGVSLVSLQKEYGMEQRKDWPPELAFEDFGPDLDKETGAFMDTAAIIKNLDLIITSDTAISHLAGALGAPVWVMLSKIPDWRWGLEGKTHSWYPTMRLFRQREWNNWEEVFNSVYEALIPKVGGKASTF